MKKTLIALALFALAGCTELTQAVQAKRAFNDAKVEAWFLGACDLNLGGIQRRAETERTVIFAACPPMKRALPPAAPPVATAPPTPLVPKAVIPVEPAPPSP